jgi:lipoprotein-releasing system ATP-binding protein
MSAKVLEAHHINKYFHTAQRLHVLKDISFSVNAGEFTSIVGKSGCGKSTLLYILSTMDTDYTGKLIIDHQEMTHQSEAQLARVRNEKIGFVFQFHYLLNEFSVLRNVMIPGLKLGILPVEELEHKAMEKLTLFGIADQAKKHPHQLSGGQKQRVAIARALINDPIIIMGDEPTGNLDNKNSQIVFELFRQLASEYGQTLLIVTHDMDFAEATNHIIEMEDGRILNHH